MQNEAKASSEVAVGELGESLFALRLSAPGARQQMQWSLGRLGQLTPVQAYRAGDGLELIDGFKRLQAARALAWPSLRVEVQRVDAAEAKVRLWRCNAGAGLTSLEEAWLVRALCREDRLTQPQVGQRLGRHKSWVCRRLALAESLSEAVTADVRLGLLSATTATELARLQRRNQDEAARCVARRGLTSRQAARLVEALLGAADEAGRLAVLKLAEGAASVAPEPERGTRRRTPAEQLVADAFAMRRLSARLHARLMAQTLSSLGPGASAVAAVELLSLKDALASLCLILESALSRHGLAS